MSDNPPATRKEAERAAAALLQQQLLGPINDLHDARQHAEKDHTAAADEEAEAILAEAKQRAKAVRQRAREQQQEAQAGYADAYKEALGRGWSADQLTELGYARPRRSSRRTQQTPTATDAGSTAPDSPRPAAMSEPAQH